MQKKERQVLGRPLVGRKTFIGSHNEGYRLQSGGSAPVLQDPIPFSGAAMVDPPTVDPAIMVAPETRYGRRSENESSMAQQGDTYVTNQADEPPSDPREIFPGTGSSPEIHGTCKPEAIGAVTPHADGVWNPKVGAVTPHLGEHTADPCRAETGNSHEIIPGTGKHVKFDYSST